MASNTPSNHVRDSRVYFNNQYVPHARWSDFQDLGQGYGLLSNIFFSNSYI